MRVKGNKTEILGKYVKSGLTGGIVTVLLMLMLSALLAYLTDRRVLTQERCESLAWVIQAVSFFVGALTSSALVGKKKLQAAGIALGVGFVTMMSGVILIWDGAFEQLLQGLLVCVASCAVGVGINMIPRKGKRKVKVRYC